eukprot:3295328-Pyramimonas_sp.AAC.1
MFTPATPRAMARIGAALRDHPLRTPYVVDKTPRLLCPGRPSCCCAELCYAELSCAVLNCAALCEKEKEE